MLLCFLGFRQMEKLKSGEEMPTWKLMGDHFLRQCHPFLQAIDLSLKVIQKADIQKKRYKVVPPKL